MQAQLRHAGARWLHAVGPVLVWAALLVPLWASAAALPDSPSATTADAAAPDLPDSAGAPALPLAAPAAANGRFWQPNQPGSDLQFHPLQVFLNGGWDILRNPSYQDRVYRVGYADGLWNVADQVRRVPTHLGRIGWGNFASRELFPYRGLDTKYGAFVPNWFMHTLGEGMLMRKLEDWYAHEDVAHPRLAALGTLLAMQVANEVTENGTFRGSNADPIADLLLYNPLGYLLFSIDEVAAVFGPDGPMTILYWPGQAALVPGSWRLVNQGENFAFHLGRNLPLGLRGFMYYGKQGLFGLAAPVDDVHTVSLGVGPSLRGLSARVQDGVRTMEPGGRLAWEVGAFVDRNGSLLASAVAGVVGDRSLHINVYPGILPAIAGVQVGSFVRWGTYDGWYGGLSLATSPLGLAAASDKPGEAKLLR